MKHLYQYKLPMRSGKFREGLILQVGEGFGEIAPLPGYSSETLLEAKAEILRLLPSLQQKTASLPSVRFGIDCALQPFPGPLQIKINALDDHRPGFEALKVKLGHLSLAEAVDLVKTMPQHLELRLDFNRLWSLDKLLRFAEHFTPADFAYLEEPASSFSDLVSFSKMTGFPVAIDESIPSCAYWDIPSLKALVVKPSVLGKIPTPPPGVEIVLSSSYESGIGTLHLARIARQLNPDRPHGLDPYTHLVEDLLHPGPSLREGILFWENKGPIQLKHHSLCLIASAH